MNGATLINTRPEPRQAPDPTPRLHGTAVLDDITTAVGRYTVLPSVPALHAVALWIATTHALPAFEIAPRLVVTAPEKRCGKSRLLDLVIALAHNPLVSMNASSSAVFRSLDVEHPPTLIIDEADALFGSKRAAEQNEDLRALLNAGHQRGRPALRCVGPQQTPTPFPTFAMCALAGIGDMPDTITDRAINIAMRRRAPGETVQPYRERRDGPALATLRERLAGWLLPSLPHLRDAITDLPLEDRAADTWEPLVAVADLAGGPWPDRSRAAALALTAAAQDAEAESSLGVRLLTDCRDIFATLPSEAAYSADITQRLRGIEDSPWQALDLTVRKLAHRLNSYGIQPKPIRLGPDARQARGYRVADFTDAFNRYLPPAREPSRSVAPSPSQVTPVTISEHVTDRSVTRDGNVTGFICTNDAVTLRDASHPEQETREKPRRSSLWGT